MEASDKFMFVNIREYLAEGDNDKVGEPESISRAPRSSLDSLGMLMIPCATLFCFSPIFSRSLQSMMPNSCIMVSLLYNIVYRTFLSTSTVLRLSFPLSGVWVTVHKLAESSGQNCSPKLFIIFSDSLTSGSPQNRLKENIPARCGWFRI